VEANHSVFVFTYQNYVLQAARDCRQARNIVEVIRGIPVNLKQSEMNAFVAHYSHEQSRQVGKASPGGAATDADRAVFRVDDHVWEVRGARAIQINLIAYQGST